ncbi:MAG: sulfite exporter TauE/SafE family protein [Candidatus Rokubacteria bacterium]|nr:sulfite exporter TauE/SafE family protein [Candidatus Rokubacteria bacterium]
MIVLAGAVAALIAGFVKGTIGFGFPTVATPLLALFIDVKTAVAVLVPPNLVLDGIQARRGGGMLRTFRRFAVLLAFGGVGTVLGTHLLVILPARVAMAVLGAFVIGFVAVSATRWRPSVRVSWERWLSPPVGLLAGVVGGLTNVPGTPLVVYFYALGLAKADFVRAVAVTFFVYKVMQLAALAWYGAFTVSLIPPALGVAAVAFGSFTLGLRVQDRLDQQNFNRVVLVVLALLGAWLTIRASI